MARLHTCGFESQSTSPVAEGISGDILGVPTITTATKRSGAAALSAVDNGTDPRFRIFNIGTSTVAGRSYYIRAYARISAIPTSAGSGYTAPIMIHANGVTICETRIHHTDALPGLFGIAGAQVGSNGSALSANTWYRFEVELNIPAAGNGTLGFYIDGVQIARSTSVPLNNSVVNVHALFGAFGAGTQTNFIDDIAINDDQGATQNTFPGAGSVVLLKPTSDSAVGTGWEAPQTTGADVTNIFTAVANTPPLGVAHSDTDANNAKYVFNATSTAVANYDVNCTTYTAAGVGSSDVVKLVYALIVTGSSSATDTAGAVDIVSNPDQGSETAMTAFDNGVAGTWPTLWRTTKALLVDSPSVTKGTAPVLRVGKRTATTRVAMVALMGIVVEYAPATVQEFTITTGTETDAALALAMTKQVTLTPATETDSAQPLTFIKTILKSLTPATETDTAPALNFVKPILKSLTPATETDEALQLPLALRLGITPATETDSALALDVDKQVTILPATETDLAMALSIIHTIIMTLTPATETDTALPLAATKQLGILPASEVDTANALTFIKTIVMSLLPATETDSALPLTMSKNIFITPANETDVATALTVATVFSLGIIPATETDTALPLTVLKRATLTPADETDTSQPLDIRKLVGITTATETDVATALTQGKLVTIIPATEIDTAQALNFIKPILMSISPATETDEAMAIIVVNVVGDAPEVMAIIAGSNLSTHSQIKV